MQTEDKFLLSSLISFITLIIWEIIDFIFPKDNLDYNETKLYLNISLFITIFIASWFIGSLIGFFIAYKIEHGNLPRSSNPDPQPIPAKWFIVIAFSIFTLPPIGWTILLWVVVYYKIRI